MKKFIFILLFMCIISPCFAATQLLKTVKPSGGDYTSLEACMNANEQNLVTADKYFDVEIDGTWSSADTTAVVIHNYTTDATRYINIYTTAAARHNGTESQGYNLAPTIDTNTLAINNNGYMTINGLIVSASTNTGLYHGVIVVGSAFTGTNSLTLKKLIIIGKQTNTSTGISANGCDGSIYIYNSIIYGFNHSANSNGIYSKSTIWAYLYVYLYNVTFYDNDFNINNYGEDANWLTLVECKNVLSVAADNADYQISNGSWVATSTNNLSSDATAPALNTYYINKTITFVDVVNKDFHLASGDTDAIDLGVDLSAAFTDDIDGVTRSGTWDIGADEFVAAGVARRIWAF